MEKNELRKIYKAKRQNLDKEVLKNLENNIYTKVMNLNFSSIENVHIFLSINTKNELDTYPIIKFLRGQNKNIIISKTNFEENTLNHYLYNENTLLETSKWGIPEPVNAEPFDVKKIDLIFVPMLISDKSHYRVGYGKGFYDRFISECKQDVKTVGLNFFKPIDIIEDVHEFDVSLDEVIIGEE